MYITVRTDMSKAQLEMKRLCVLLHDNKCGRELTLKKGCLLITSELPSSPPKRRLGSFSSNLVNKSLSSGENLSIMIDGFCTFRLQQKSPILYFPLQITY
jgi:hypothetical protein